MGCGHEDYPCCGCGTDESLSQDDLDDFYDSGLNSDEPWCDEDDGFRDDVEADADTLRSCGWGTDEDYGYYGE